MNDILKTDFVASPCISVCALDEDDVCVGCYRTGMEISHWGRLTAEQQRDVVERSRVRMFGGLAPCLIKAGAPDA